MTTTAPASRKRRLTGYPKGWFVISFSDELAVGELKRLDYFGKAFALFRGEDGAAVLLDAHCAHMGASMADGGRVVGNTLECPFHAWRYASDGRCVEIPYAKKIPPKACVKRWQLQEKSGLIHMWYDPAGGEPQYALPELPEWEHPDWTRWTMSTMRIKTHPKEIVENVVDLAHFPHVHFTDVVSFENEFDGHMATQRTRGIAYPVKGVRDEFDITATYFGPAVQISWMSGNLESRLVNAHTPVNEGELDLRFGCMVREVGSGRAESFARMYAKSLKVGFFQDIAIWEHKKYRDAPVLCDGDGPFMKLRRWYAQFYADAGVAGRG